MLWNKAFVPSTTWQRAAGIPKPSLLLISRYFLFPIPRRILQNSESSDSALIFRLKWSFLICLQSFENFKQALTSSAHVPLVTIGKVCLKSPSSKNVTPSNNLLLIFQCSANCFNRYFICHCTLIQHHKDAFSYVCDCFCICHTLDFPCDLLRSVF